MNNHYHLVVETPEPTLSRGMRQLNGVYTQRFNRRHRKVGHLFQVVRLDVESTPPMPFEVARLYFDGCCLVSSYVHECASRLS